MCSSFNLSLPRYILGEPPNINLGGWPVNYLNRLVVKPTSGWLSQQVCWLTQQLQNRGRDLIGLSQHGCGRFRHDLIPRELGHLLGHIHIPDDRF